MLKYLLIIIFLVFALGGSIQDIQTKDDENIDEENFEIASFSLVDDGNCNENVNKKSKIFGNLKIGDLNEPISEENEPVKIIKSVNEIKHETADVTEHKVGENYETDKKDTKKKNSDNDLIINNNSEVVQNNEDNYDDSANEYETDDDDYDDDDEQYTDDYNFNDTDALGDNLSFSFSRNLDYSCDVSNLKGYCLTPGDCKSRQGVNLEGKTLSTNKCGKAGKICCQPRVTCGNKTNSYISVFTPGGNNLRAINKCNLLVNVADESICQIRIDFVELTLSQPTQMPSIANAPMSCNLDSVVITGSSNPMPIICSSITGEHMYAHINQSQAQKGIFIEVNLVDRLVGLTSPNVVDQPSFEIHITQLQCPTKKLLKTTTVFNQYRCSVEDFYLLAPPGCLQYYTEPYGQIKSLTFDTKRTLAFNLLLSNLNYAICFKKVPGANCLKLTVVDFSIGGTIPNCMDRVSCTEILQGNFLVENREICGSIPANTKIHCPGENPFVLKVRTDGRFSASDNGFRMNFENPPAGECPTVEYAPMNNTEGGGTGTGGGGPGGSN